MAMITRVEDLSVDIPQTELMEYNQQRDGFMAISKLCAGTVHYENEVKSIQSLLPSETKIKEFNEKEKLRLKDQPEELAKLEVNLEKKLESHAAIICQIAKQTQEAKQFRQTIIDTFGSLEKGSVLSKFVWSNLCGQKFTDESLDKIQTKQLNDVQTQLEYLSTVRDGLQLMNEKAIQQIAENLKNVVDGGSQDLKNAMNEFQELTDKIAEKERKLYDQKKHHDKNIRAHQRKIDEIRIAVSQKEESDKIFLGNATELLEESQSQIDSALKRHKEQNTKHEEERTATTARVQKEKADELKKQRDAFDQIKNQSADKVEQDFKERRAEVKKNNAKQDEWMKDHKAKLDERLKKLEREQANPQLPPSQVDYDQQRAVADALIEEGQRLAATDDVYTWFKVTESCGFLGLGKHTYDERRKTKDNSGLRAQGNSQIAEGKEQLKQIAERQAAETQSRDQVIVTLKKQAAEQIARTGEEYGKLNDFYKKQEEPEMPDLEEARNKKFEETKGFASLNAALNEKVDFALEKMELHQKYDKTTLKDTVENEESLIIQQALAFILKFKFKDQPSSLAEVMGCLNEVVDKTSPKQISDQQDINKQKHDSVDAENSIKQEEKDKQSYIEGAEKDLKDLQEKLSKVALKLETYKDSSPVPLDSLYEIYNVLGNIRKRQDNVKNIQQLIPNCIDQFRTRCQMMITGVEGLKSIPVKTDDVVQKELKIRIGKEFNTERREKQLLQRWVEDIAGDDETYEPIIKCLNRHAKIMSFEKFKQKCEDAKEREEFVNEKCAQIYEADTPPLDKEQLSDLKDILESLSSNVEAWEADYFEKQGPILKYMDRYNSARNAFHELVKQIRFMPNTQQISADIVLEIEKAEKQGQQQLKTNGIPTDAIEGNHKLQAIEESKEAAEEVEKMI